MKISIRVSILTIFVSLLLVVGSVIIAVEYYMQRKALLVYVDDLIHVEGDLVLKHIVGFLRPPYDDLNMGAELIKLQVIAPGPTEKFAHFLLQVILSNPGTSGVGWGDNKGNFCFVERESDNVFVNVTSLRSGNDPKYPTYTITKKFDKSGRQLGVPERHASSFDLFTRPWYQAALGKRQVVISDVYLFYPFGRNNSVLGISFVKPIYNQMRELQGMLTLDIRLNSLSDFVSQLHITPNAHTLVFDNSKNVIAGQVLNEVVLDKLLKVSAMSMPWIEQSLNEYQQYKKDLFFYSYMGTDYLAFYGDLAAYKDMVNVFYLPWHIAVILPVSDITGPLYNNLFTAISIAILVLIIGAIIIMYVAQAIAKPITELANDASSIKQLDLQKNIKANSYIKEIFCMQDAFTAMKSSLKSFVRYIPITLVKKMLDSGSVAHVGGENKVVTFLFSDICNFTALSARMSPTELTSYLSEYFDVMTKVVLDSQGTLDKYIGDGIMAFWGAPADDAKHAWHACQCAVAMLKVLADLNAKWHTAGKPSLAIRIGINTGDAVVGNVGSEDRLNYTAMGDSVNVASRLEELNKLYGTSIIINQTTYQLIKEHFVTRWLDKVIVRGKDTSIYIYEILLPDSVLYVKIAAYNTDFQTAFDYYVDGDWDKARVAFAKLFADYSGDKLAALYLERCDFFKQHPPQGWQGIWRM